MLTVDDLKLAIRDVPDFPRAGILFKDITPIFLDSNLFEFAISGITHTFFSREIDVVVGVESRGFILGAPVALELNAAFVPARKAGKLPAATQRRTYDLEYGSASLEIHTDAIKPGQRVLVVDDVLATGGTARAAADLVRDCGGQVIGLGFLAEISVLGGRLSLRDHGVVHSLISY